MTKKKPIQTVETDIAEELAVWLPKGPLTRASNSHVWTHPNDPNFAAHVKERTDQLRTEHQLVTSLAELRKSAALTQTQVAERWGRSQARVSHLETNLHTVEMGSLLQYVNALGGTLEIRVTVGEHTYHEQLA
jgi:predicted XRE-type DNA-binding protein